MVLELPLAGESWSDSSAPHYKAHDSSDSSLNAFKMHFSDKKSKKKSPNELFIDLTGGGMGQWHERKSARGGGGHEK